MTIGDRVPVDGVGIDPFTEAEVVSIVSAALERGAGGRIVTPNVDILRLARSDPAVRSYLADATVVVADGMPLVWASRLAGTPLPERVPGSSLIWSLSYHLSRAGRSVYLLGGVPGDAVVAADDRPGAAGGPGAVGGPGAADDRPGAVGGGPDAGTGRGEPAGGAAQASGASRASAVLAAACPGLRIAGAVSPPYGFERDPVSVAEVCAGVVEAKPDVVFVGLGFPKQELLIDALRAELPASWFIGCGAAINFVAGHRKRAPLWMQRAGLEWLWRLAGDPRRLAGRYLRHDAPYALRLLAGAAFSRSAPQRAALKRRLATLKKSLDRLQ